MFLKGGEMRVGRDYQPLSYDIRLPDSVQVAALRLLDASRAVINAALTRLWPHLDAFMREHPGPAWKQVAELMGSPDPHGDRQWRCESETVGRLMRAQAARKQIFLLIQPILSDGFIRPTTEKRPAGKDRTLIKEAITALQTTFDDDEPSFVTMLNVIEACCNFFLREGHFPKAYEELQPIPLLTVGLLTYAGDDGGTKGQAYRLSFDLEASSATLRLRTPDETGTWPRDWHKRPITVPLPACLTERLKAGVPMAPTLREVVKGDGSRVE